MELNTLKTKCKVKSWKELVLKIQDEVRYTDEFHQWTRMLQRILERYPTYNHYVSYTETECLLPSDSLMDRRLLSEKQWEGKKCPQCPRFYDRLKETAYYRWIGIRFWFYSKYLAFLCAFYTLNKIFVTWVFRVCTKWRGKWCLLAPVVRGWTVPSALTLQKGRKEKIPHFPHGNKKAQNHLQAILMQMRNNPLHLTLKS